MPEETAQPLTPPTTAQPPAPGELFEPEAQTSAPQSQPAESQASAPPAQPSADQPPVQPTGEKKKISKKLLILLVVLFIFLGLGGWLYATGALKISGRFSITKPGETPTPVVGPQPSIEAQETPGPTLAPAAKDKYSQDTDSDGVPDFVEVAIGYNPQENECALKVGCGSVGEVKTKEVNILFILDSSGSMAGNVPGGQKMAVAKEALKKYVDQLPESINAGLMVYGHQGSNSTTDKAVSCAGIELLYPIQKVNKEAFKAAVDSFQPTGWTPIADSFQKAKEAFDGKEGQTNKIVLVSDGIETCEGDPCAVAKELKTSGIEAIIDVIGFDVDEAARAQLKCVADVSGGKYFDAATADEFLEIFDQMGQRAQEYAAASGCLAQNLGDYLGCLMDQLQKAFNYLTPVCTELMLSPETAEEGFECNKATARMNASVAELGQQATGQTGEAQEILD